MTNRSLLITAAVLDAALLLIFALIGRNNHALTLDAAGILTTAAPFLIAASAGWITLRLWRTPCSLLKGFLLWLITVAVGHLLRLVLQQGEFSLPFVLVSAGVLAVFLIGWRAIFAALQMLNRAPRGN